MKPGYDKLWFQTLINQNAIGRAEEAIQRLGKSLPCTVVSGSSDDTFVTVKFEIESDVFPLPQITIPKAESPYFRTPVQAGDQGVVVPADVYIGNVTGYGGVSTFRKQPNLSTLYFMPLSNSKKPSPYPGYAVQQGPSGFVCRTLDGACSIVGTESGITFTVGDKTWTLTSSGFTMSSGVVAETHLHPDVQSGTSDTGAPISG